MSIAIPNRLMPLGRNGLKPYDAEVEYLRVNAIGPYIVIDGVTYCDAVGTYYAFTISSDGVVTHDLIPVRVGTTGYMYDRVTGRFFGNAGTGNFVLGPDVVPVEWLESTGTQYIDTGVVPTIATQVEATVMPTDQIGPKFVFGCRDAAGRNVYACLIQSNSRIGYRVGDGNFVYASGYPEVGAIHKYGIANGVLYRDGAVVSDACIGASLSAGTALALLALNTNGTYDQQFVGRLYSCSINNSSVPVRNLRPVRVGTDATSWEGATMDVLTRRIHRNKGTGAFTYGDDLNYPIPA